MSTNLPPERARLRVSDSDRESVAEQLREAAGDGRITLEELDERLTATYAARTYGDLVPITDDLPGDPELSDPALSMPDGRDLAPADTVEVHAVGTTARRTGAWRVPRKLVVRGSMGSAYLDFRQAVLPGRLVEIEIEAHAGSVAIVLPDGATATMEVTASFGTAKTTVPEVPAPGQPHFRVTGRSAMGSVRVRYAYGHWWRRWRERRS
ncbi:DUF1707 SHOCT-like domain-containing protein [Allonocardiopsis opalescens]|uniref:Cell wall-active antibiotic response 4TMS protein YvqF n=1 Tax=Allonocardiopsis opalescens TaxID=1144618 RepID=A0A2T0QA95_9ACTN|nr:DUF1707 domain-containing protein [Allonocardiopsis opalescens]PRY00731.1 cell wall-active antibiotic response 4TMS protein YvqF [Allonocardiopsis opalescens]